MTGPPASDEAASDEAAAEVAFQRLYGAWAPLIPGEVAGFLAGFDHPWWLVGGWAIEAFTGVERPHEDIDVVVFRRHLADLRASLGDRWHLWSAGAGALRPVNDDWPDVHPDAGQVWVREHALAPWVADIILNDDQDGLWVSRRDPAHVAPLEDVTWVAGDGIRYARPEVVLHHKARLDRPKDRQDLAATWRLLDGTTRRWLLEAVTRLDPDHPWLGRLSDG